MRDPHWHWLFAVVLADSGQYIVGKRIVAIAKSERIASAIRQCEVQASYRSRYVFTQFITIAKPERIAPAIG